MNQIIEDPLYRGGKSKALWYLKKDQEIKSLQSNKISSFFSKYFKEKRNRKNEIIQWFMDDNPDQEQESKITSEWISD